MLSMGRISKGFGVFFILIIAISSLSLLVAKPVFARTTFFPPTTETYNFSYVVSNYLVNYSIVKFSPSGGDNASGYNIIVYVNYPPFPIEISFYDGTQKVTGIELTTYYSSSFVSTNYPSQITMTEVSNESAPTPPTSTSPNPTQTPTVPEFPQLIFLPLFLFVFSIVVIIRTRKNCVRRKHRVSKH